MGQPVKLSDELVDDGRDRAVLTAQHRRSDRVLGGPGKVDLAASPRRSHGHAESGRDGEIAEPDHRGSGYRERSIAGRIPSKQAALSPLQARSRPCRFILAHRSGWARSLGPLCGPWVRAGRGRALTLPLAFLDERPIVIALAGSNGSGKTTFFESFLADTGLRFVNPDVLSGALNVSHHEAGELAAAIRTALVHQRGELRFRDRAIGPRRRQNRDGRQFQFSDPMPRIHAPTPAAILV